MSRLSKNGPERERYSDSGRELGSSLGGLNAARDGFYGYCVHAAVCRPHGPPCRLARKTAASHESNYVAPLLDTARSDGFAAETCPLGMGYDNERVYAAGRWSGRWPDPQSPACLATNWHVAPTAGLRGFKRG
jgi:hypothetical protein